VSYDSDDRRQHEREIRSGRGEELPGSGVELAKVVYHDDVPIESINELSTPSGASVQT
jgi:hypothetical protein